MARHPDPAIEQAISCYLQNELLPAADELLRRVQAAALILRDLERAGISLGAADRLEMLVVLLNDAERAAEGLKSRCC